jgi:peptidoglycan/LPS O-acetylase OafA/YrhL
VVLVLMAFLAGDHRSVVIWAVLGLGIAVASVWDRLSRDLATTRPHVSTRGVALACMLALGSWGWTRHAVGGSGGWSLQAGIRNLAAVTAALLAMCFAVASRARWLAPFSRVAHYLGRRAYSVVLVHDPIIVAYAYLYRGRVNALALFAVVLPFVVVVTELFYQVVELPVDQLAGRLAALLPNRR